MTWLFCTAATAFAADTVLLSTPVTYLPDAGVVQNVRHECHLEDRLATHVGAALAKLNRGGSGTVASAESASDANVLHIKISHVLGVGGGAYSGPKAITVQASLVDQSGALLRQTRVNRWSMGGVFAGFKGTCSILDRCAVAIGKDMQRWVRDASYVVKDEGPPSEGAPGQAAPNPEASPSPAEPAATPASPAPAAAPAPAP